MKKNIFFALGLLLFMASCSNDDYLGGHYTTDGAGNVLGVTSANKAWTAGDHIGLFASTAATDASTRNRDYVVQVDGHTLLAGTASQFFVKGTISVLAYHPFTGSDGAEPELLLNTLPGAIQDYELAKVDGISPESAQQVALNFSPCLSTLNVTLQLPAGEHISRYVLSGVPRKGRIDPYSFAINAEDRQDYDETGTDITGFTVPVVPQTLAAGAATLTLKGVDRTYPIALPEVTIAPNSICNVTVDVAEGQVTYEFINNGSTWADSGLGNDNATSTQEGSADDGDGDDPTPVDKSENYSFDNIADAANTIVIPTWGAEVTSGGNALNMLAFGDNTFGNRLAVGPTIRNNDDGKGFKFNYKDANRYGLYSEFTDRFLSVLNLKAGDKVTFTFTFNEGALETLDGTAIVSGTPFVMAADGNLDLKTTVGKHIWIQNIKIEPAD